MDDRNEISKALSYIDPHDRETWIRMGAGIKTELGEEGFSIWDQWSSSATNYHIKAAKDAWKSFKSGRVSIGSVFYEAKQNGYTPDKPYQKPDIKTLEKERKKREEEVKKAEKERQDLAEKAKDKAHYFWQKAQHADPNHPYLIKKGVDPEQIKNIKQLDQSLLIPVRKNGDLVSLQFIDPSGKKTFLPGGEVKGCAMVVGDVKNIKTEGYFITEGFATAATLNKASNKPVFVAFNAGNLHDVAETMAKVLPNTSATICLDNDLNHTSIKRTTQSMNLSEYHIVLPSFTVKDIKDFQTKHGTDKYPTDFNDLEEMKGIDTVKKQLKLNLLSLGKKHAIVDETSSNKAIQNPPPESFDQKKREELNMKKELNSIEVDLDRINIEPKKTEEPQEIKQAQHQENSVNKTANFPEKKNLIIDILHKPKAPPEAIQHKYLFSEGKYYDVNTGKTVLFEDKGKKLTTAKEDIQTVHDMLEVAKEKGWGSIKISGSKEFKRLAYIEAESQGIKTKGYSPSPEDIEMVNRKREEYSLNKFEQVESNTHPSLNQKNPSPQDKILSEGEKLVKHGSAPYLFDKENKKSYFVSLEKDNKVQTIWGVDLEEAVMDSGVQIGDHIKVNNLGKVPVEVESPIKDENGQVTKYETIQTHKNLWEIKILNRDMESSQTDQMISDINTQVAQSATPSKAQINTSIEADSNLEVKPENIPGHSIPSEVIASVSEIKSMTNQQKFDTAKTHYDQKSSKLYPHNLAKLKSYEKNTMDIIDRIKPEFRETARFNFYESTSQFMNGKKLNLPEPQKQELKHDLGLSKQPNQDIEVENRSLSR